MSVTTECIKHAVVGYPRPHREETKRLEAEKARRLADNNAHDRETDEKLAALAAEMIRNWDELRLAS